MSTRFFTCIECSPDTPPHPAPPRGCLPTRCAEHKAATARRLAAERMARFRKRHPGKPDRVSEKARHRSQNRFDQQGARVLLLALAYGRDAGVVPSDLSIVQLRALAGEQFDDLVAEAWTVRRAAPHGKSNEYVMDFLCERLALSSTLRMAAK